MIINDKLVELESWEWWKNSQDKLTGTPGEDWEKWSHTFNKDIRSKIKEAKNDTTLNKEYKSLYISGLSLIFRMWQLQYHLAYKLKTGKIVGQKKKKMILKQYREIRKDVELFDKKCEEMQENGSMYEKTVSARNDEE